MKPSRAIVLLALPLATIGLGAGIAYAVNLDVGSTGAAGKTFVVRNGTSVTAIAPSPSQRKLSPVTNQLAISSELDQEGLTVTVDGVELPRISIVQGIETAEQSAIASGQTPEVVTQPTNFEILERQAIALKVLNQLLYTYAEANGLTGSSSQAASEAQANYQTWISSGSPTLQGVGNQSGTDAFTSPSAVAALQEINAIQKAKSSLAGESRNKDGSINNRADLLKAWMQQALKSHNVALAGTASPLDVNSLPDYLPSQM